MDNIIGSDNPFTDDERNLLRQVAGLIIPASNQYNIPGADDETIFGRILVLAAGAAETLKVQLEAFENLAANRHKECFSNLDKADKITLLKDTTNSNFLNRMIMYTAECYYADGRVLESINLKSTPPFPGGYELEQGDWSLLDPVRKRKPFYKKV